jgi:hypothetical protein
MELDSISNIIPCVLYEFIVQNKSMILIKFRALYSIFLFDLFIELINFMTFSLILILKKSNIN